MIDFGREALNPDNFALMGLMKQNTAADLMEKVLKRDLFNCISSSGYNEVQEYTLSKSN